MSATLVGSSVPQFVGDVTLDPTSVPAWKIQAETFAVTGVAPEMVINVKAPSLEAGLILLSAGCTTVNVLTLTFWNPTSAAIDPASQSFRVLGH